MESNKLMQGNWLNGSYNGFNKDVQVYNFTKNKIQHTDAKQEPLPINTFKPIQLTETWLLKCGFDESLRHIGEDIFELIHNKTIGYRLAIEGQYVYSEIKYVHQLQNLYQSLCQKELIIKNTNQL